MNRLPKFITRTTLICLFAVLIIAVPLLNTGTRVAAQGGITGVTQTITGKTVTINDMKNAAKPFRAATAINQWQQSPRHVHSFGESRVATPPATKTAPGNAISQAGFAKAVPANGVIPAKVAQKPVFALPQTVVDQFQGPTIVDSGWVPPDTMGTVGPTEFFITLNGVFRAYDKVTHAVVFDETDFDFWNAGGYGSSGVSDPHVRYDRNTQRWFITQIDLNYTDNNILLAVSSGPTVATAAWTLYELPGTGATTDQDNGCFVDYDTPGIDQSAMYIGANMFCPNDYAHSNIYVVNKASAIAGAVMFTAFYNASNGNVGPFTPQGVDNYDASPVGYVIGPANEYGGGAVTALALMTVNNPGGTPTLSGPTLVAIPPENGTIGGVTVPNTPTPIDDLDDRLFAAVIRNGHLWTAHNVGVDATGNANGAVRDRDAVRWYDLNVGAWSVNQLGTVFDSAPNGFENYWMGTVMVSGQGHAAMGMSRANAATSPEDVLVGRFATDAPGALQAPTLFQSSAATPYDDGGSPQRWGDYSYTSLDPCDDMTMWTVQEFIAPIEPTTGADWSVEAAKLQAPPPAVLPAAAGSAVLGRSTSPITLVGSSPAGQGFYDTPSTLTDPCRKRLTATVTGGATVNAVIYTDPTHISLDLNTLAAKLGTVNVTITNPDGQTVTTSIDLISGPTGWVAGAGVNVADPALTKLGSTALALPGEKVSFTLTVTNNGTQPATGIVVTDPIAAPFVLTDASQTQGTNAISGNTVTFNVGTVNPGQVVTLTVNTVVSSSASTPQDAINTATMTWTGGSARSATASVHVTNGRLPGTGEHPIDTNIGLSTLLGGLAGLIAGGTLVVARHRHWLRTNSFSFHSAFNRLSGCGIPKTPPLR